MVYYIDPQNSEISQNRRESAETIAGAGRFIAGGLALLRKSINSVESSSRYIDATMKRSNRQFFGALTLAAALLAAPVAVADDLQQAFEHVFHNAGAAPHGEAAPRVVAPGYTSGYGPTYGTPLDLQLASLASAERGRIGVAALDLSSGRNIAVLGDQPFPLASTGKVAIVATFLDGVDQGRFHLYDSYPLLLPVPSRKFSSSVAPVRPGPSYSAQELIELALTRSDNHATDALLAAMGGPQAVDRWLHRVGIGEMRLDRDITTLVRDDGAINPATTIDVRDSTTPQAMVRLLSGLYEGQWLSPASREVLLGAMSRCQTGVHRMRAAIPDEALVGHKTGTLANTSSDVGMIRTPDGHTIALAIYVTGQGSKPEREQRIAAIARAIYNGYQSSGQPAAGEHLAMGTIGR